MNDAVTFGPYRFDPQSARLWSGESEIRLTPKSAAVLGVLVQRAGQPVTKQELFSSVWGSTIVSDDALVTCIQELRKALKDDAREPDFIETRHRSGYRFVATVAMPAEHNAAPEKRAMTAIAVLPFTDMSPGRDQDYFCEGLAEELIDALTQVEGLRVAARSLSFQFRTAGVDLREAGRRLGVDAIVEGSVRKAGDRVRITVQLVDVVTGYQQWSQRFEREVVDVFAIQDEIAASVATTLRGGDLSSRERQALRRPATSAQPYEYFLRGRQSLHRMRQPDLEHSREMFERAIELDRTYAPAWAGLATVHALLYEWWGSRTEDLDRADRASETAMQLAPELADAHVARGIALSQHRRYDESAVHFEAAIRINPYLYDAYYYYGRTAFARGAVEQSADLFGSAARVRPEDFQSQMLYAQSLFILRRTSEANEANRAGIVRAERLLALNPVDGRVLSLGSGALHFDGQIARAIEWAQRALELYPDDMSSLINAACLMLKIGRKEEALTHLEHAFGRGWGKRDWIEHDPDYNSLRDDPRFQALLAKLS
ncbi:TolB-like protein/Flp pilus assembly protein TadD [Povalibacter uvarum]|uniref:TolB-like protein/Flp pilus assembly protein TadD n=1 Tax=Povalibacter uvarum TaxID=732238 RepID=A0A841HUJ0_9GAMM|nr:winged helix-turn-helix domain-containing protein [Povalibacter uvarum]MBB6096314.1 TolB-like protein/Flp pilus assembly protein TadD [Povalibacter uvarum]